MPTIRDVLPPAERRAFQAQHAQALLDHARHAGEADLAAGLKYSPVRFRSPQLQAAYQEAFGDLAGRRVAA